MICFYEPVADLCNRMKKIW